MISISRSIYYFQCFALKVIHVYVCMCNFRLLLQSFFHNKWNNKIRKIHSSGSLSSFLLLSYSFAPSLVADNRHITPCRCFLKTPHERKAASPASATFPSPSKAAENGFITSVLIMPTPWITLSIWEIFASFSCSELLTPSLTSFFFVFNPF